MTPTETAPAWTPDIQGLWFEDCEPGRVLRSARRTLTEADIVAFAGLSGDFNPIHLDELHAAATPMRGRIAHGMLVMSIASGLAVQLGVFHETLVALAGMDIQWQSPVRAGDTLGVRLEVQDRDVQPGPKRGRVRFAVTVQNQLGKDVAQAIWHTVFLRRPRNEAPSSPSQSGAD